MGPCRYSVGSLLEHADVRHGQTELPFTECASVGFNGQAGRAQSGLKTPLSVNGIDFLQGRPAARGFDVAGEHLFGSGDLGLEEREHKNGEEHFQKLRKRAGPGSTYNEHNMPCCVLSLLSLITPRLVLVLVFLFSDYLGRAYHGLLIPLLGFIFLPLTTLVYAWEVNERHPIEGIYLVALIVAVVIDLGGIGGGHYSRRQRE